MLDTVLYLPVEFDSTTDLVIHLVVEKTGAAAGVRSPKLTVGISQSSYTSMTYRIVGAGHHGNA